MNTPSQTIGPFFGQALPSADGPYVVPEDLPGGIWLRGQVHDGAGEPVPDALLETWQADPDGLFVLCPEFRGFGRAPTDETGRWAIFTVKPGRVGGQAPHIAVSVFARGLLDRVVTRIYFADEPAANAADPVLGALSEPRRSTLLAQPALDGYLFDITLQGEHETVFFDV